MRPSRSTVMLLLFTSSSSVTHLFAAAAPLAPPPALPNAPISHLSSERGQEEEEEQEQEVEVQAPFSWAPAEHGLGGGIVDQVENWIRSDLSPTEYKAYLACINEKLAAAAAAAAAAEAAAAEAAAADNSAHSLSLSSSSSSSSGSSEGLEGAALRLNCHTRIKSARTPLTLPGPPPPRQLRQRLVVATAAAASSEQKATPESKSLVRTRKQAPSPFDHLVPSWATRFMHAAVRQYQHRLRRSEAVAGKAAAEAWPAGWPRLGPAVARREAAFGVGVGAGVGVGGAL
ncbi:MAG: hypothetical protein M1826_004649 [Phylliscum demangeonii]|nr:MAG: hypothetical protein M1826_004649 [Phylliscum demangeonii]